MAVDSDGGVYVANLYAPFLRVWSPDGRVVAFMGQKGSGPGEFQFITNVYPTADGGFFVVDIRLHRWTFYGAQGDLIRTTPLPGGLLATSYSDTENALYGAVRARGCRAPAIRRWALDTGAETTVIEEMAKVPEARASGCPAAIYNLDTIPSGGFGIGFGFDEYLLFGFDATGSPTYEVTRDVAKVPRTADEMEVERGRIMRIRGSLAAEPDTLRRHFMGSSLRYDAAGRAWVRTERGAGNNTIFDIFSPGGEYIGEVTLAIKVKSPGRGFDLAGDYLVTVHADEASGTEFVRLWRVSWPR